MTREEAVTEAEQYLSPARGPVKTKIATFGAHPFSIGQDAPTVNGEAILPARWFSGNSWDECIAVMKRVIKPLAEVA